MGYWSQRSGLEYYQVVRRILDGLGPLHSVLDVGSWDTPVVTWADANERITVDTRSRPEFPGVQAVVGRWPDCDSGLPVCDVVLCLQRFVTPHLH